MNDFAHDPEIEGLRLPPFSEQAEQSVLGAMLVHNSAYDRVHWLASNDFYQQRHREIYGAILKVIGNGKVADTITVMEQLRSDNLLQDAGGLSYLHLLVTQVPSAANVHHYATIVKDKAVRRGLLEALMVAQDGVWNQARPVSELLDEVTNRLLDVAKDTSKEPRNAAKATEAHVDVMRRRRNNEVVGIPTGLADIDKKLRGLQRGNLVILAGRPSMGKSVLAFEIAENAAAKGFKALCLSMEMTETETTDRAVSRMSGIPLDEIINGQAFESHRLEEAYNLYGSMPLWIDEQPALTPMQAKAKARAIKRRHGLDLVVLDHLQLMRGRGQDRNAEIGNITGALKAMAKELDVAVVLLSQLNRKCEDRNDKRPLMSDLRDSGNIEQDADVIMLMYREEYYYPDEQDWHGIAECNIAKNRQGTTGMVPLFFRGSCVMFGNFMGNLPERRKRHAANGKLSASDGLD